MGEDFPRIMAHDYGLTVAVANATEGAARSTTLKVTQAEPNHGFVAWQAAGRWLRTQVIE